MHHPSDKIQAHNSHWKIGRVGESKSQEVYRILLDTHIIMHHPSDKIQAFNSH